MKFFELKMRLIARLVVVCCFVCLGGAAAASAQQQGFEGSVFPPAGWTFSGGPASLGGVANSTSGIAPTEGSQYGWISVGCSAPAPGTTCPAVATMATPSYATLGLGTGAGLGSPTTETVLTSPSFTLTSSMQISFEVNFITTDGTTNFADFALVRLIPSTGSPIDLFVANTTAAASAAVPPVDLNAGVGTMNPSTASFSGTSVTFGATTYGNVPKFGGGPGGPTGWIQVTYMAPAGTYTLQFSVSHVGDTLYPSALAIDDVRTSQVQTTPAATNSTTDTTVSTAFNSTTSQHVENDVIVPPTGNLTFPTVGGVLIDSATLKFQSTNRIVSNANSYTIGTPFALFVPFDHAGDDAVQGTTGNGSNYEVVCSDATHPAAEANCPFPTSPGPGAHIRAKDIFAFGGSQPTICTPGVACGTTVSFAHWAPFGNTAALGTPGTPGETSWVPSSTSPHPACPSPIVPASTIVPNPNTPPCNLEDILTNMSGDLGGGSGSDTKKGDYFLGNNVPMLQSTVNVTGANGTMSVNTRGIQGSSPFLFRSPLTFRFNVAPAQLPAGLAQNFTGISRDSSGSLVTVTMSALPAGWVNGTLLTINANDTANNFPPICAAISNVTSTMTSATFTYTQSGTPNVTGSPAGGTASNTNCWVAAPVFNLFYHFDPLSGAPDYPSMLTDLNDLTNCPVTGTCTVTAGTPGASSTANVEFTTTPVAVPTDGQYLLQWSAADTVRIRERYIRLLPSGSPEACPNPLGLMPPPMPPCYSTKLFKAQINVDNTAPTIAGPTLSTPNPATPTTITATYSCADPMVNGVASGIASCGSHTGLGGVNPTPTFVDALSNTVGPHSFSVTATDVVGNSTTSPTVTYTVYNICALYDQTRSVKGGAVFPIKIELCDASGNNVSSSAVVVTATGITQISFSVGTPEAVGSANPDNNFRYDNTLGTPGPMGIGGYIYNLSTGGLATGTYSLQFTAGTDPTAHAVNFGVK